jgi:hypothetical protein
MLNVVDTLERVREAVEAARVDVLCHSSEGRGVHMREAGHEAWVRRKRQEFVVGHAVLGEDMAQVLGLIQ